MSRQFDEAMEERAEAEQLAALASALDLGADYLAQFDYEVQPHESDDGILYGYNVTFLADAPEKLRDRLQGNYGARWLRVGPL
nr:hypothetical protein [Brevundimonas naejangsanensis]